MRPTLYEPAGGRQASETFAAALHARSPADPELNHPVPRWPRDGARP
ncbi:MAG TPA: hypothetical protein VKV38_12920 [Trebonia sp.]|nr:hypothetical protein [Trebonia sp.]